jgi:hypothetical protein
VKLFVGLIALVLSSGAYAQASHSKAAAKPLARAKAHGLPMGCKLVGTVRGTKLWAGDCTNAVAPAAAEPTEPAEPVPAPDLKE